MLCFVCNHENPESMSFCGACGTELGKSCSACGKQLPHDSRFCNNCGRQLDPSSATISREGERRQLTILFCDLVDSTGVAEHLDPEDLRDLLNLYHKAASDAVERYDGTIAQYLGDGVLAYFGLPKAHEDDGYRAVLAGIEILQTMQSIRETQTELHEDIGLRLGIHTGVVVVGEIGSGQQTETLALGAAPNVAARIQGLASPNELLLSSSTHELVNAFVDTKSIGTHKLKGVDRPIELFRVVGLRPGIATRLTARLETPYVGREVELNGILSLQKSAHDGEGRILVVKGEPGVGKTRLLHEARSASESAWLVCRCSAHHIDRPLYPLTALLEKLTGDVHTREDFSAWFRQFGVKSDSAEALISNLLGLSTQEDELPPGLSNQRNRTVSVLADLLLAMGSNAPTTLVVEDLHWSDPSTKEVLDKVAVRIGQSSLFVVITSRDGIENSFSQLADQTTLEVLRLTNQESRELVRRWAEGKISAQTVSELVSKSDGIPLFLEEVTRYALSAGPHTRNGKEIPLSLRDAVTARLDALGPAKPIAQLAALLGRHFQLNQLVSVSTLSIEESKKHLDTIVASGLIIQHRTDTGLDYVFKHALVQDTAYESMLKSERRRLHAQILKAIEAQELDFGADLSAWHYKGAGETDKAIDQYEIAAQQALGQWALTECIALFNRALELLRTSPSSDSNDNRELSFLNQLVLPIQAYQNFAAPELFQMLDRKLELVRSLAEPDRFNALISMWDVYGSAGNKHHTVRLSREVLESAQRSNDEEVMARAHETVGHTHFLQGQLANAADYLDRSMGRYLVDHDSPQATTDAKPLIALMWHGWTYAFLGRKQVADQSLEMAVRDANQSDSPLTQTHVFSYLNLIRQDLEEDPEIVLDLSHRMRQLARKNDMEIWSHYFEMHAGWAKAMLGDADGIAELETALERAYTTDLSVRGHSVLSLVKALLAHGRIEDALLRLDEADAFFQRNISCFVQPDSLRLRANCLALSNRLDAASRYYESAIQLASSHGNLLLELKARRDEIDHLGRTDARLLALKSLYQSMPESHEVPAVEVAAALLS